jgi:7,8-dihydro-6-hydroxymethylpterin-pyrophosphokinase
MDMTFTTLTDAEEKELYRLQRLYWQEALGCEEAKAYLAGCVMLGSALETLLILMINCHSDEAALTGKVPMKKDNPKPLLDWKYIELLRVAKAANWLPSKLDIDKDNWNSRKAMVGDYAEVVRMVRNLVHPASYAEDHYRRRVTAKYLQRQFEVVLLCRDWLVERNDKALLEHMKSEGIS